MKRELAKIGRGLVVLGVGIPVVIYFGKALAIGCVVGVLLAGVLSGASLIGTAILGD